MKGSRSCWRGSSAIFEVFVLSYNWSNFMDPKSGFYDGTYLHGNSNLECIPEDLAVFGWSADSRVSLCSDSLHWA